MRTMTQTDQLSTGVDSLSFEDAIQSLEDIVLGLEEGDVELDSLVVEYKKGVKLLNYCRGKVEAAEVILREVSDTKPMPTGNISDDR